MKRFAFFLAFLILSAPSLAQPTAKRAMSIDDLFKFQRVADPKISPDGKWVVYSLTTIDNVAANKSSTDLWLASTDGNIRRQLTNSPKRDTQPNWSPDGKSILFVSNRSGDRQLWIIDLDGGEARQLTEISTDVSDPIWSRDGKHIAFVSAVWPEFSDKPYKESDKFNKDKADEREKSQVKARVFTRLFFRHWDEYVEDKRLHVFVCDYKNGTAGEPRDVTPGDYDAFPTSSTFGSNVDYTFSPDGTHILFTAPPKEKESWSTNHDIWRVSVDGMGKPENLTKGNLAADGGPQFSPDGKKLAYTTQKKPDNEADRWEIVTMNSDPSGSLNGAPTKVSLAKDVSVEDFVWLNDQFLVFCAEEDGVSRLFAVPSSGGASGNLGGKVGSYSSLSAGASGKGIVCTRSSLDKPPEVIAMLSGGDPRKSAVLNNVSKANTDLLDQLDRTRPESVTVKGADNTPMQMWILKPPGFDPAKKWPVAYLVHGGPQGAWTDGWSYRWCPQLWAAQGYIVALPNPRGSTGFGQKYCDEISGDWGGKCYIDLMKGVDYLESLPYVDKNRIGAAGASFGGYMMDWFAVNTGRFKTLITHCSVWNFDSMYGTTDELWFDELEHGGPPWGKNREVYEKHSPHKFAANLGKFKTPMLVIHNDLDFRCPIGQGHELFTALQRQGVPSRMINFPDEGHWVSKPANSKYWHAEVFAWLKKYVPPGGK